MYIILRWPENRDYFEWIKKVRNPGSATIGDIETLLPSCLAIRDCSADFVCIPPCAVIDIQHTIEI